MKKNRVYVKLGVMLLCVVLASVAFTIILSNLQGFFGVISSFIGIISPVLYGILFAYLMNPIMKFVENALMRILNRISKPKDESLSKMSSRRKLCHIIGVVCALGVLLLVFYLAIVLVVPTIIENVSSIVSDGKIARYYSQITEWLKTLLSENPDIEKWALGKLENIYSSIPEWLNKLDMKEALVSVTTRVYGVVKGTMNFLIGLVVAVYMLLGKEKFLAQGKKLVVALFSEKRADRLLEVGRRTNKIFSGFVLGKIIDSAIIGVICYIVMSILALPFPMLISVIIGVTNVIPFFGPLIGAIPSAFLILLDSPMQCLIFIFFIVLLQQFDGNILGPRILGDSVGLNSFWILISITVFSGIFGFAGMVLGVPVFAVIYMLVKDFVDSRLKAKDRPQETEIYRNIRSTDDIELAQKMAEFSAEHAAFDEDDFDAYEEEPEIEDLEEEEIEAYLERLEKNDLE